MLGRYRSQIYVCTRCGDCRDKYTDRVLSVCPVREHTGGFEPYYARGRVLVARGILEGNLRYSDSLADVVHRCLLCGNCEANCLGGIEIAGITKAMRADIVAAGLKIPEGVERLGRAVEKTHNIFGAPPEDRPKWVTPEIRVEEEADLLYFPGCVTAYRFKEIAHSTAKILNRAGVKFATMGSEEWCCGDPLFMTGQLDLAREAVEHGVARIKESGAKRVLTACAGCYRAMTQEWPEVVGDLPFEVVHSTQLLTELIDAGKIELPKGIEETVTYHDPCEIGRHCKIYDEPRKIIGGIPRIKLVEMVRNRADALCCGAGGGVKASYPDMAVEIAGDSLEEAEEAGATTIVSACPTCKWNIRDAVEATRTELKVVDVTELVAKAMGL